MIDYFISWTRNQLTNSFGRQWTRSICRQSTVDRNNSQSNYYVTTLLIMGAQMIRMWRWPNSLQGLTTGESVDAHREVSFERRWTLIAKPFERPFSVSIRFSWSNIHHRPKKLDHQAHQEPYKNLARDKIRHDTTVFLPMCSKLDQLNLMCSKTEFKDHWEKVWTEIMLTDRMFIIDQEPWSPTTHAFSQCSLNSVFVT